MRALALIAAVGGCYAPEIAIGLPCPDGDCPGGQVCIDQGAERVCEPIGAHADGGPPGPVVDAGAADARATHVEYVATVAECLDPKAPSPELCTQLNGPAQLAVDDSDTFTLDPWNAYLRFDLDAAIESAVIARVTLRLVATDDAKAAGPNSGSVWAVEPFTVASLSITVPPRLGVSPLEGNQGAVSLLETVEWDLPLAVITTDGAVYLGLTNPSSDGVAYWNLLGPDPPRLLIELE